MADEAEWKRRFLLLSLVRLAGITTFLLGVAIAYGDLLREGGWPQVGAILAIVGALDTVLAPRLLKQIWDEQDGRR